MRKLHLAGIIWLIISIAFLNWLFISEGKYLALYYVIFFTLIGIPLWKFRSIIQKKLQSINIKGKFLLLGYAMVLLEEIFAAFSNHLTEGFSLGTLVTRIFQFQLYNIFAFTGFVLGWWLLSRRIKYSEMDIFLIAGTFGLFGERIIYHVFDIPLMVAFFFLPTMFSYYLIILPSMLSLKDRGRKMNFIIKYPLSLAVLIIASIIPILVVTTLRANYPFLFPPTEFIPA